MYCRIGNTDGTCRVSDLGRVIRRIYEKKEALAMAQIFVAIARSILLAPKTQTGMVA